MPENGANRLDTISKLIQVLSVVAGVLISILSVNHARQQDANARKAEAETRRFELTKYENQRKDEAEKQRIEAAKTVFRILAETVYGGQTSGKAYAVASDAFNILSAAG